MRSLAGLMLALAMGLFAAACGQIETTPPIYASLASAGQQLNVAEAQNLINSYRRESGLEPLQIDQRLMAEAGSHASDMARQDKIGHK
ncbi:MAG: hypothetical protein K8F25_00060, partial [Fimbriimonadaceae bacterium]|nr:hypothetical protein [Alphaproteobacteria bacterium]